MEVLIFCVFIIYTREIFGAEVQNFPIEATKAVSEDDVCGWRNTEGIDFGTSESDSYEVKFGEFPWLVVLMRTENLIGTKIKERQCGGSLIAPNVVLTTGICAKRGPNNELLVRAGEWDTQNTNESLKHVDILVKEIITHENYSRYQNDIALLIMEDSFVWQKHIRPICLSESHANFDNSRCFVAGWGTFAHDSKNHEILTKIDLPVIPRDICQNYLRQTKLGQDFNLHESFVCAGGEKDKDICTGGAGSPLFCPISGVKNRYYQAGIVSWGPACGKENAPGVYTNVAHFHTWITEKLDSKNISYKHFAL